MTLHTELQFLINKKTFKSLLKDLQNIVLKSMCLAAYVTYIQAYHSNSENLEKIIEVPDDLKNSSSDPLTRNSVTSNKVYKDKDR